MKSLGKLGLVLFIGMAISGCSKDNNKDKKTKIDINTFYKQCMAEKEAIDKKIDNGDASFAKDLDRWEDKCKRIVRKVRHDKFWKMPDINSSDDKSPIRYMK